MRGNFYHHAAIPFSDQDFHIFIRLAVIASQTCETAR